MVALGLIERGQIEVVLRIGFEDIRERPLRRSERAEREVLMHLAEFGASARGGAMQ